MDLKRALEIEQFIRQHFTEVAPTDGFEMDDVTALLMVIDSLRPKEAGSDEYERVAASYRQHLPMCKGVSALNSTRKNKMVSRWREYKGRSPQTGEQKSMADWWDGIFRYAAKSEFLTGTRGNDRGWVPNIDFFLQPSSLTKLLEGYYHSDNRQSRQGGGVAYWMNEG